MSDVESIEAEKALRGHKKSCPLILENKTATIGGRTSYYFAATGLGMACGVRCACGWSKECTDVSNW